MMTFIQSTYITIDYLIIISMNVKNIYVQINAKIVKENEKWKVY